MMVGPCCGSCAICGVDKVSPRKTVCRFVERSITAALSFDKLFWRHCRHDFARTLIICSKRLEVAHPAIHAPALNETAVWDVVTGKVSQSATQMLLAVAAGWLTLHGDGLQHGWLKHPFLADRNSSLDYPTNLCYCVFSNVDR